MAKSINNRLDNVEKRVNPKSDNTVHITAGQPPYSFDLWIPPQAAKQLDYALKKIYGEWFYEQPK